MTKIVIATDSFKGSLTSLQVAGAVEEAVRQTLKDVDIKVLGISDGGEGFAETVTTAMNGKMVEITGHDALQREIQTSYGIIGKDIAVMDVASTIGVTKLKPYELNPVKATSFGAGEMIRNILKRGIRRIVIGLGGSATNDCGHGMIDALKNADGLDKCEFIIATDVMSPLCGPEGATYLFARQKGATDKMLAALDMRNRVYAEKLEHKCGHAIINQPGAGASGGIGAALMTMKQHSLVRGIEFLLDLYDFENVVKDASLIITGEGKIDPQTMQGKAPYGIGLAALKANVPSLAICGLLSSEIDKEQAPWNKIIQVSPPDLSLAEAMKPEVARQSIVNALEDYFTTTFLAIS